MWDDSPNYWASQVALVVKDLPANAGDIKTWVQSLDQEEPLEKETAVHSGILAWRIPWTEEPWWATVRGVTKSWTRPSG